MRIVANIILVVLSFTLLGWDRGQGPVNGMDPGDEYRLMLGISEAPRGVLPLDDEVYEIPDLIFKSRIDLNIDDGRIGSRIRELISEPFESEHRLPLSLWQNGLTFSDELVLHHRRIAEEYLYCLQPSDINHLRANLDRILQRYVEIDTDLRDDGYIALYAYLVLYLDGTPDPEIMGPVIDKLEQEKWPRQDIEDLRKLFIGRLYEQIPTRWAEYERLDELYPVRQYGGQSPAANSRQRVNKLFDMLGEQHYQLGINPMPWLNATILFPTLDRETSDYICELIQETLK